MSPGIFLLIEKELFEFRVKEIKKRKGEEETAEEIKKSPFNLKEEFVIFAVLILVFGFDIFSSH